MSILSTICWTTLQFKLGKFSALSARFGSMQYSFKNRDKFWLLLLGLSLHLSRILKSSEEFGEILMWDSGEYFLAPRSGDMAFLSIKSRKLPSNKPAVLSGVRPCIGDGSSGDAPLSLLFKGVDVANNSSATVSDGTAIFEGVAKPFCKEDKNFVPASSSSELSCRARSFWSFLLFEPPLIFLELAFSCLYIFGLGKLGLPSLGRLTFGLLTLFLRNSLELATSLELVKSLSREEQVSMFWESIQACFTIFTGWLGITDS